MSVNILNYDTIAFDCDGIILNSNKVKTQAFYNATIKHGEKAAQAISSYNVKYGGISRFQKFEWLVDRYLSHLPKEETVEDLLASYAAEVQKGLMSCEINPDLETLKEVTKAKAQWMVVSGGAESELHQIFEARGLSTMFERGIFGSPDTKDEIFSRELENGNLKGKALFIGDSKYDYESSTAAGLDFVFISQWTEFKGWKEFCEEHSLNQLISFEKLIP